MSSSLPSIASASSRISPSRVLTVNIMGLSTSSCAAKAACFLAFSASSAAFCASARAASSSPSLAETRASVASFLPEYSPKSSLMRASNPFAVSISAFLPEIASLSALILASSSAISLLRASFADLRRSTAKSVFLSSSFCSASLIPNCNSSSAIFAPAASASVFSLAAVIASALLAIMASSARNRKLLYSASLSFFSSSLHSSCGSSRVTSAIMGSAGSKPSNTMSGSICTAGSLSRCWVAAAIPADSASRCLSDLHASSMLMPLRTSSRMRSFSF